MQSDFTSEGSDELEAGRLSGASNDATARIEQRVGAADIGVALGKAVNGRREIIPDDHVVYDKQIIISHTRSDNDEVTAEHTVGVDLTDDAVHVQVALIFGVEADT